MSSYIDNIINEDELLKEITKIAFNSVNKNENGAIDIKELDKIMTQISYELGAEPPTKEDVKDILQHLDSDRSGVIEEDEFQKLIKNILTALVDK